MSSINHLMKVCLIIAILTLWTVSCGSIEQWGEKPSEDWSRSIPLGESVVGSIGVSVEGSGERVHAVVPYDEGEGARIRYIQLNSIGEQVVIVDLNVPGQLKFPRLLHASPGNQHLVWASRQTGESNWRLWYALLGEGGELFGAPKSLSPNDINVGKYVIASDQMGGAVIVWDRGDPGELYYLHIDAGGNRLSGPMALGVHGEAPSMVVDETGVVHLLWMDERDVFYDQLNIAHPSVLRGILVVDLNATGTYGMSGDSLGGPRLGYADGWVYILWSVLSYFDVESGTASTEYVAFPADAPREVLGTRIWTLMVEEQPYREYSGSFNLSGLGPAVNFSDAIDEFGVVYVHESDYFDDWNDVSGAVSDYLMNPAPMIGSNDELAVVLTSSQKYRNSENLQILIGLFKDGQYQGYSVATKTQNISDDGVVAVDDAGNMHLFWRE
ncbi:MAG: hypothetical protein PVF74_00850, partial [Anaerolineales bacterium]